MASVIELIQNYYLSKLYLYFSFNSLKWHPKKTDNDFLSYIMEINDILINNRNRYVYKTPFIMPPKIFEGKIYSLSNKYPITVQKVF